MAKTNDTNETIRARLERGRDDEQRAYRRGVHQALAKAAAWVGDASDLAEVRRRIVLAAELARQFRSDHRAEAGMLLDQVESLVLTGEAASWAKWKPAGKIRGVSIERGR